MKELTKGKLVMTEDGIAEYQKELPQNSHSCRLLSTGKLIRAFEVTNLTRADVEAYLKEKGWESHVTFWAKEQYYVEYSEHSGWYVEQKKRLFKTGFDTAPKMQAEAILMAKLLNATKDNLNL